MRYLQKETAGGFGSNAASVLLAWVMIYLRPPLFIAILVSGGQHCVRLQRVACTQALHV